MVKPAEQRAAVTYVLDEYATSERHACRLMVVPRATYRYQRRPDRSKPLRLRIRALAQEHPRWGLRRIWELLKAEKHLVGRHRVSRIWREERLQVKRRLRKRLVRPKLAATCIHRPNQRWAMDFVADRLNDGRPFRVLVIIDVFTRECLSLEIDLSLSGERVKRALARLVEQRGERPEEVICDNGPEFVSRALTKWCQEQQIRLLYIQPGRPMQNGHVESFNGRLRDECLNLHAFSRMSQARLIIGEWRRHYNVERPHSALGNLAPRDFIARLSFAPKQTDTAESPTTQGNPAGALPRGLDSPAIPQPEAEI